MYFKCIRVCERIQSQKAIFCIIPYIWYSRKDKRLGTYQVGSWRGLGVGGRDYKISSGNFVGDENILYPEYWSILPFWDSGWIPIPDPSSAWVPE